MERSLHREGGIRSVRRAEAREGTVQEAQPKADLFGERLATLGSSLAPAGRKVAHFIDRNRVAALASSALEIAAATGTSDATVVRAVQSLGFAGLADLKQTLVASLQAGTPADNMRRTLDDVGEDTGRAVDLVLETHAEAIAALRAPASRGQLLAAVTLLHPAERIVVFGIGPSAALARYVSALLGRSGRRSRTLDVTGSMLADQLLDLRAGDALLLLAYGRVYREIMAVFAEAGRLGLPTVLVTDSLDGKLASKADVVVGARRGRAERVALHGTTLVGLEAIVLGLSAAGRQQAIAALERLNELRGAVSKREGNAR